MEYKPYTYLIGWSKHNKWYYGVAYTKNSKNPANPENLWKTYFTSSKYVKKTRELLGEPDIVQIRKTFNCSKKALNWEKRVLQKMNVINDNRFLNKNIGGCIEARPGIPKSNSMRKKLSMHMKGNKIWIGKKHSEETKNKIKESNKGKKRSAETRKNISQAAKRRSPELVKIYTQNLQKPENRYFKLLEYNGKTYIGFKQLYNETGLSRYRYYKYLESINS